MTGIPAGWYDDPENATQYRYWDGTNWSDHRAPKSIRPSMADADATAVISRGLDLFKDTWIKQLAIAAIATAGVIAGAVLIGVAVVTGLEPDLFDIVDRVTDPDFDSQRNPADEAFLESITFDASAGPIALIVIGAIVAGFSMWLGMGTAATHVAAVNAGATDRPVGTSLRYGFRKFPRWIGISLLWLIAWALVLTAIIGIHILLITVSPAFLLLLIPLDLALAIYGWPYATMMSMTLVLAPDDIGPFRRTVALIRPRWPGIAGRVLLVNLVLFAANIASNVVAIIPIVGVILTIPLMFALYAYQIAATVALYEYLDGPLDPELQPAAQTS